MIGANIRGVLHSMNDQRFDRKTLEAQLDELRKHIGDLVNKLETAAAREAEALRPPIEGSAGKTTGIKTNRRRCLGGPQARLKQSLG